MRFNLETFIDFVMSHGYGEPTPAGIEKGKQLMQEGDGYASAAAEIVTLGLTMNPDSDYDSVQNRQ